MQEAALLALRGYGQFEPGTNFRAWFYRILTNCAYGRHRQRGRRPQTVEFDDVPDLYLYSTMQRTGAYADNADPAGAVLGKMTVDQVMAAIQALPEEYRTVAVLYFVDDLTYEEIGARGFVSLGALKGNIGDQNYRIPAGIDLSRYRAVSVWCRRFGVNFGAAPLAPVVPQF